MKTIFTLLSIGALTFAINAFAADSHNYNGIACDYKDPQSGNSPELVRDYYGVLNNSSIYRVWVSCPVPVDSVGNLNGTEKIEVIWRAEFANDIIKCNFSATDDQGVTREVRTKQLTGSGGFTIPNISKDYGRYGTYQLNCELPQRGILHSYLVTER